MQKKLILPNGKGDWMKRYWVNRRFGRVGLASAMLIIAVTAFADSDALFLYKDREYKSSELSTQLQQSLYKVENERHMQRRAIAETALFNFHVEAEAKRQNKSAESVARELLAVDKPEDAAVAAFYEQNKGRIRAPLDQVRDQIVQFLADSQVEKKRSAIIAELKREGGFKLLATEPEPPLLEIAIEGYPFKGKPTAHVTLVEFADYQCPHCRRASFELKELMKSYNDKVKLVFRDFPINRSGISRRVAEGAVCADMQGKFWEYHDLAFEMQAGLNNNSPNDFADILALDMPAFKHCLDAPETKDKVAQSKAEANSLGVNSTPTFYINGRILHDHDGRLDLRAEIEKAIASVKKN